MNDNTVVIAFVTASKVSVPIEKLLGQPTPLLQEDNEPNNTAPSMNI